MSSPPVPADGLSQVLSGWSGQGQLLEALAAVAGDEPIERRWTARDIRRRAHRVFFAELLPDIAQLPATQRAWADAIPAASTATREIVSTPAARVDWAATSRLGWPPRSFAVRRRARTPEELLTRCLVWALDHLDDPVAGQLAAARGARTIDAVALAAPERPDRHDLSGLRHAGRPWRTVAAIAARLITPDRNIDELAARLIAPDEALRWRLFHLAVLGELLLGLRDTGMRLTSLRPLSAATTGPVYQGLILGGPQVEIWFEAAGVWAFSSLPSPYREATAGLDGAGARSLGPDLLLVSGDRALIVECKYSASGAYVATGYEQILAYAAELQGVVAPTVEAVLVGPDGVVRDARGSITSVGPVHVVPASDVRSRIRRWAA